MLLYSTIQLAQCVASHLAPHTSCPFDRFCSQLPCCGRRVAGTGIKPIFRTTNLVARPLLGGNRGLFAALRNKLLSHFDAAQSIVTALNT